MEHRRNCQILEGVNVMKELLSVFLVFICFGAAIYAQDGLIGYWSFDEDADGKLKDLSGSKNDGTIKGKPQLKQGKSGMALAFSKPNKDYIEIIDNDTIDISEGMTMSAWINPSEIYIGGDWKERNCIMAKVRAYYLDITETGNLASYLYNVQPQEWLVGETDMKKFAGKWVHVASTYDGKEHNLYINGELDASVNKSGTIAVNADNLYIGWVDNNRYFDGLIDEVQLWSKGISAEELKKALAVNSKGKLASCWGRLRILQ